MKMNKLFNVLVIGGSMLTSVSQANDELIAATVFCTSSDQCTEALSCSEEGDVIKKMVPKDGLSCCWGTSCADLDRLEQND